MAISQSSYLAEQVLADLPLCQIVISQIPTLTAHISLLLWELIFGRSGVGTSTTPEWQFHICQTRCWQIYPLSNGDFTDACSSSPYLISTLRAHIWQKRCWQISLPNDDFKDSCSDSAYFIPTLRAHIWQTRLWQIYLWNGNFTELIFGRSGVGTSTSREWQFHIWQTRCWQIYNLSNGDFTDDFSGSPYLIPTLTAHVRQKRCWQISLSNDDFTDSCAESSYFIPTPRAHIWQTRCWQIYPPV